MLKKVLLVLSLLICLNLGIFGIMNNYWQEFDIKSSNSRYVAKIRVVSKPEGTNKSQWKYQITVYELSENSEKFLWKSKYDYNGEPKGILSNDGKYFAYVGRHFWEEVVVVSIQGMDQVHNIVGKTFSIKKSNLKKIKIGKNKLKLWLRNYFAKGLHLSCRFDLINGRNYLAICTIDGKMHFVDAETGKVLRYKDIP